MLTSPLLPSLEIESPPLTWLVPDPSDPLPGEISWLYIEPVDASAENQDSPCSEEALNEQVLLSSEQLYRREVQECQRYSPQVWRRERERILADLVQCAREGDRQARNQIIESCLRSVEMCAAHLASLYQWHTPPIEYQELVGIGNLTLVEKSEVALSKTSPANYLFMAAKWAMINSCQWRSGLIVRPCNPEAEPMQVLSLDAPISAALSSPPTHTHKTLAEVLSETLQAPSLENEHPGRDWGALHRALQLLTQGQREVLIRLYGLYDQASERLVDVERDLQGENFNPNCLNRARAFRDTALSTLERILGSPVQMQEVYTGVQARAVLGVSMSQFSRYRKAGKLTKLMKGFYCKEQVDALATTRSGEVG